MQSYSYACDKRYEYIILKVLEDTHLQVNSDSNQIQLSVGAK